MSEKKILYVDNLDNIRIGLGLLPMDLRSDQKRIEYDKATSYIRAKRKLESKKYSAVIIRDLEIPHTLPERNPKATSYRETDYLVMQELPIQNALNLLRISKDMRIPTIAILNSKNHKGLIKVLDDEGLAHVINEGRNKLSIEIHNALEDILKIGN